MLFYQWGSKWPPLHGMGNITTFIYSHLPHSTVDLSSLYHSVRTAGNWAMSMGLAIPFCQTATQTLWERKRKKKPPPLSSLPMVPAWAWESWKTAANTQSKPSHVTNLGRQGPQHMTQTGTTACTRDPNQPERTNARERAGRGPSRQAQVFCVPCATQPTCCGSKTLPCYLASIQIPEYLLKASVGWGLFTVNPGTGSTP